MSDNEKKRSTNPAAHNVRNCPLLSASTSKIQNEPTADADAHDVRNCPLSSASTSKKQNEPTAGAKTAQRQAQPELELSPRQLEAINLLFAGQSFVRVSRELGVDARTLRRWRQSAAFAAEVKRRYRERAVARKPPNRTGGLIPPATPLDVPEQVNELARQKEMYAHWLDLVESGKPFPPVQPGEPYWVKVLRARRRELGLGMGRTQQEMARATQKRT